VLTPSSKLLLVHMTLCTKTNLLLGVSTISLAMLGAACCCDELVCQ